MEGSIQAETSKDDGIIHKRTTPFSPEQNGVSEHVNCTLIENTRTMLEDAGLDRKYWGEAINTATYLKNRSPTNAIKGKTPEEVWTGRQTNISHLKAFGCKAMKLVPKQNRTKLDSISEECIFVGYSEESKAYRLINSTNPKRVLISRDVKFLKAMRGMENQGKEVDKEVIEQSPIVFTEESAEVEETEILSDDEPFYGFKNPQNEEESSETIKKNCESKHEMIVDEALSGPHKKDWKRAMESEMNSLTKNYSFELVDPPTDEKL
ncbi:hypothetical protein PR048_010293 [Dryococelus australis]|uniref:Integrase catalytic domain-containing protein n=1 Tax=Dryococelus australis TaxID=614101 RepID=A0ABQ9I3F1_9NEOP|nr:hypothetical protein PR048_010293 [Dryococelus australis]